MNKYDIQVAKEHYYKSGYDSQSRFLSYYNQITTILNLEPKTVLEIGIGNKTVANYLAEMGIDVDTCDFDTELEPDFVADIRDLSEIPDNSYDVVVACEVLEHIPWEDVDKAVKELKRISKGYVVVSIPWSGWAFNASFYTPLFKKIIGKEYLNIGFLVPRFYANIKWRGEHYWEIGSKDYPLRKIKEMLQKNLDLVEDFQIPENRNHHYFVLIKNE